MLNEFLTVPVGQLRKNPWNTNRVSPGNEAKIRESLTRNGFFRPIIVRTVPGVAGYEIIGGEHRWEQAIELGMEKVPVCNLGDIDELKAKEIGIIDNARYGADDTASFAALLKEIGDPGELMEYLPYGEADLDAIFSSVTIVLDDLEFDENFEKDPAAPEEEAPVAKLPKTHTNMRFRLSIGNAERLTALIARTQKEQGFTTEDDLTNAGDALTHLLAQFLSTQTAVSEDPMDELLDTALKEQSQ